MSSKKMTVKECITDYKETCDKIRELEKYKDTLHKKLEEHMKEKGQDSIANDQYILKITDQKRETVSRKQLPLDVWNQYKQTVTFTRLSIVKKK